MFFFAKLRDKLHAKFRNQCSKPFVVVQYILQQRIIRVNDGEQNCPTYHLFISKIHLEKRTLKDIGMFYTFLSCVQFLHRWVTENSARDIKSYIKKKCRNRKKISFSFWKRSFNEFNVMF